MHSLGNDIVSGHVGLFEHFPGEQTGHREEPIIQL